MDHASAKQADVRSNSSFSAPEYASSTKQKNYYQSQGNPQLGSRMSNNTTYTATESTECSHAHLHNPAYREACRIFSTRFGSSFSKTTTYNDENYSWESVFDNSHDIFQVPKFLKEELAQGRRLGKGSFSTVDEIRGIRLCHQSRRPSMARVVTPATAAVPTHKSSLSLSAALKKMTCPAFGIRREKTIASDDQESREFIAQHCFRFSGDSRYAIKMVRREVLQSNDESNIIAGLCDLAVETVFLSTLAHPNIIKLRGIADVGHPFSNEYFVVLDRLYETLQRRIQLTWKVKEKRLGSSWGRFRDRRGRKRLEFFEDRLERAFELGSAIEYLHKKKIIHRDIKPDNIGFDVRDDIKLFDFGMAKELKPDLKVDDENYRLSFCGSPSYMAPEVWAKMPYNSSCDVYSFGIVLYEMIALRRAFDFCSGSNSEEFAAGVFGACQRPNLEYVRAPLSIKELLPLCWNENPQYRHDMFNVNLIVRKELSLLRSGDESRLPDFSRRRSTFIFQQSERELRMKNRSGSSGSLAESIGSILSTPASPWCRQRGHALSPVANMSSINASHHCITVSLTSASVKSV
ncbi:serine/threonine protein kinase [Nitzschia inconspicua]|uniref:Serine/threonine protein kinase n=1 Tax=Nitzschia inconspicua TaxID=303405 RepID=A0A9K3LV23_9STRA|nr:serine/threonine protein kinase [Nitzschia inconspicua]